MAIDTPLVVDANILFGAVLRDSTTRHLVLHAGLHLHTPQWLWHELERNRDFLLRKAGSTAQAFDLLLELMKDHIRSVPLALLRSHLDTALQQVGNKNRHDAPYVAAAIALDGAVWSHDKALAAKAGVPVWTTQEIIEALGCVNRPPTPATAA